MQLLLGGITAPFMLLLGILLVASVIPTFIVLAMAEDPDIDCYAQGIGIGFGLYGVIASLLAPYGVLGGVGAASSTGKLLVNLLVPFLMDRFVIFLRE